MLKLNRKVLRYHIKGNYKVVEELWQFGENDIGTKMISAYTMDNLYLGDPHFAKFLARRGINHYEKTNPEHSVCSIGFSPKQQKWYGWSHRAIYGFGIGSTVKPGDCAYRPATPQELFDDVTKIEVYDDGWTYQWLKPENVEIIENGIRVREPSVKCIFNAKGDFVEYQPAPDRVWEIECGRGTWTAQTLEDAKQMASDFAESVS